MSTDAPAPPGPPSYIPGAEPGRWRRSPVRRVLLWAAVVFLIVFWIWALFFATKEAVNKIDDTAWAARAEGICADTKEQLRTLDARASADLTVRADLVDESTDLLSDMIDDVVAVTPADAKGQAIVPDWEGEYRMLLENRYRYAEQLRAGRNVAFTENAVNGVPITERLEKFALDNEMPSCAPPRGSVI